MPIGKMVTQMHDPVRQGSLDRQRGATPPGDCFRPARLKPASFALLALLALSTRAAGVRAETVSLVSIGCDTVAATQMASDALRDQMSGKDLHAFDRITAYRAQAGQQACRPLSQGDSVDVVHTQEPYLCVREHDERLLRPGDPECYWILHRHLKLPDQ